MQLNRRRMLLLAGAALVGLWCSAISGVGGWVAGHDFARREASLELGTAIAAAQALPDLGVVVTRLDRTGPAAAAGVQRGDLLVGLDGAQAQDARDMRDLLRSYAPGDRVRLDVRRANDDLSMLIDLAPFPGDANRPYLGIYYTARGEEPGDL